MSASPILPGRGCGTCTLCCKVLSISELSKPQGQWCQHCAVGKGCRIYQSRPEECSTFHCGYLSWPETDARWFPATSKMVIVSELEGKRIAIHLDPSRPAAWREQPFYDQIKRWSFAAAQEMAQVVVCVGNRATVVLPEEDVDLGPVGDDERIMTAEIMEGGRKKLTALKLKADDPRIANMRPGVQYGRERSGSA